MISEKKKASNYKWDRENMVTLGCRMRREKADEFRQACQRAGTSPNAVFRQAVQKFMESQKPE